MCSFRQNWIVKLLIILVAALVILSKVSLANAEENDGCVIQNGQLPPNGKCRGPIHRAMVSAKDATAVNGGCPKGEILYFVDNDPLQPQCGKCIPGKSGADDEYHLCALNQYCTDNATCADIRSHPLFGAECPYEPATSSGTSFCGTGLHCYRHKCLPCLDGMIDYADGKVCVMNVWTYDKWANVVNEPIPTILFAMVVLVAVYGVVSVTIDMSICCVKRRSRIARLKEAGKKDMEHKHLLSLSSSTTSSASDAAIAGNIQDHIRLQLQSAMGSNLLFGKDQKRVNDNDDEEDYEYEDEYDEDEDEGDDDDEWVFDGLPPGAQETQRAAAHRPSQSIHFDERRRQLVSSLVSSSSSSPRTGAHHRSMTIGPSALRRAATSSGARPPPPPPVPPLALAPSSVDITIAAATSPRGGVPPSGRNRQGNGDDKRQKRPLPTLPPKTGRGKLK